MDIMANNEAKIKTLLAKMLIKKAQEAKEKIAPKSEIDSTLDATNKQSERTKPIKNGEK